MRDTEVNFEITIGDFVVKKYEKESEQPTGEGEQPKYVTYFCVRTKITERNKDSILLSKEHETLVDAVKKALQFCN